MKSLAFGVEARFFFIIDFLLRRYDLGSNETCSKSGICCRGVIFCDARFFFWRRKLQKRDLEETILVKRYLLLG